MKRNNTKGFTLIELLVVVAIIGILAAVGTVAYTGYTAGAKKSATKSNQSAVVKYIAAELQKCNLDATTSMGGELTCSGRTGATAQTAALKALNSFKNPYNTKVAAVVKTKPHTTDGNAGYTNITVSSSVITIATCFEEKCSAHTSAAPTQLTNTVTVE